MIFHIATKTEWEQCKDENFYAPDRFAVEGFIHCSTKDQIERIANTLFRSYQEVWLLCLDDKKECDYIRYENLEGGDELFPHIYRKLPKGSIVQVFHLVKSKDEDFELPSEIFESNRSADE